MTGLDILHSLLAVMVCGTIWSTAVSGWPPEERKVAMYSWYAHTVGAFAIVAVYTFYYGGGDLVMYFRLGASLSRYVEYDLAGNLPQLLRLLFQLPSELPTLLSQMETSTGSMVATGGLISLLTTSPWAGSVLVSTCAAAGQAALWLGAREIVPAARRKQAMWSTFLVPSVVFWSSSLLKEAWALVGLGLVVFGTVRLRRMRVSGVLAVGAGLVTIGLFKPYILFPLVVAGGVYAYWERAASRGGVRIRPAALVVGATLTFALVLALGRVFPAYAVEQVVESIEEQQSAAYSVRGGSDFRTGSQFDRPRGGAALVLDAPYTVMTALFRPFIVESRSAMMFINSLESTLILYYLVMAFVRTGRREIVRWVWRSPDIIASVVFVLLFSLAVGLATTNLGTLSRYRLPMMPFYFFVVFSAHALPKNVASTQYSQNGKAASAGPTATPVSP